MRKKHEECQASEKQLRECLPEARLKCCACQLCQGSRLNDADRLSLVRSPLGFSLKAVGHIQSELDELQKKQAASQAQVRALSAERAELLTRLQELDQRPHIL